MPWGDLCKPFSALRSVGCLPETSLEEKELAVILSVPLPLSWGPLHPTSPQLQSCRPRSWEVAFLYPGKCLSTPGWLPGT